VFDWSRAELLKAMQRAKVPHAVYDPLLKGFAYAWLQSVLRFEPGARVLDVGCGASPYYIDDLRQIYGIEAHGMDKSSEAKNVRDLYRITPDGEVRPERMSWGFTENTARAFPDVTMHDAYAGEGTGPDESFDVVLSVSALEHIYDTVKPVSAGRMYPHYDVLRDMARMVKPGGILAFTYDFLLCYPFNPGWSPIADHEYLTTLGLRPCDSRRGPVSETFIYNFVDSLFVQADMVLSYADRLYRIAIVCFAFQKPADPTVTPLASYAPRAELRPAIERGPFEHSLYGLDWGPADEGQARAIDPVTTHGDDQGPNSDAADSAPALNGLTLEQRDVVAGRWAGNPDQAGNWATIPYVNVRAAEIVGATDLGKGFWVHMLDLYSDPQRPIQRALSLACGFGHQERTLARLRKVDACDAFDISPAALDKARQFAQAEGLHNINYECRDINDLKLTHQYDAVIAGGIHHISNLENLFSEVSRSLAPRGFLLMYEYIGPSQCQPTARQVEAINACIRLLPKKYRVRISAQRKLGVSTPEEALAAIEARPAEAQTAASERVAAGVAPVTPQPGTPESGSCVEASGTVDPVDVQGVADGPPSQPERRGIPRLLEVVSRAAAAIRRGDFMFRLRMYLIRWLQPSISPDGSSNPTPDGPPAVPPDGDEGATSAMVAGTSDAPDAEQELSDEYFWNHFKPMTREQWNAVDPSEAVRSDEIIPILKRYFKTVDVRYTGGSIMQFALYDIASNFYGDRQETRDLLDMLFKIEAVLVKHDDVPQNYAVIVAKND
jgi:SAM-dependent methyltransferase